MYGDFMMMLDAHIGHVLAALKKAGMMDDTLVIFTSDNGPSWYAKDVARFDPDSAGRLRTPDEEIIKVFNDWRMLRDKLHITEDPALSTS